MRTARSVLVAHAGTGTSGVTVVAAVTGGGAGTVAAALTKHPIMAFFDNDHPGTLKCGFILGASLIVSDTAGAVLMPGRSTSADVLLPRATPASRANAQPGRQPGLTSASGAMRTTQGIDPAAGGDADLRPGGDGEHVDGDAAAAGEGSSAPSHGHVAAVREAALGALSGMDREGSVGDTLVSAVQEAARDDVPGSREDDPAAGQPAAPPRALPQVAPRVQVPALLRLDQDVLTGMFYNELRVGLGVAARMGGGVDGGVLPGAAVHGAQALVFEEQGDPIVTWLSVQAGTVILLCTCCGVLGNGDSSHTGLDLEYPQIQAAKKMSSTCRHSRALMAALEHLSRDVCSTDWTSLLAALPLLLGPVGSDSEQDVSSTTVYFAKHLGRRGTVPVYAVLYEDIWAAVIIRQTGNRLKLAACHLLSCQTQPWGCIHAKAVNKHNRVAASDTGTAAMRQTDALAFGPDGILLGDNAGSRGAATNPAGVGAPDPSADTPRQRRRGRNMFPCMGEVTLCDAYHAECDRMRENGEERHIDIIHVEETCLACGQPRGDADVSTVRVELYTLRGRLTTSVGQWTCHCGVQVLYDGAVEGLFAASPKVVYVRVFMDAVLEICVISRSTMAAAAEYLSSLLRNTAAYADGETGQVRQTLSDAVGDFSDTLVIPDVAFQCARCGEDEAGGGEFQAILADGQIASILQEHVLPMVRPSMNVPKADFPITYACTIRVSLIRNLVRRRCRARADVAVDVSAPEERLWGAFASHSLLAPPAPPPMPTAANPRSCRTSQEQAKALNWAASTLFNAFFSVHAVAGGVVQPLVRDAGQPRNGGRVRARAGRRSAARRQEQSPPPGAAAPGTDSDGGSSVDLVSDSGSEGLAGHPDGAPESDSEYGSSLFGDGGDGADGLDTELATRDSCAGNSLHPEESDAAPCDEPADEAVEAAVHSVFPDGAGAAGPQNNGLEHDLSGLDLNEDQGETTGMAALGMRSSSPVPSADGAQFLNSAPVSQEGNDLNASHVAPAARALAAGHVNELATDDVPRSNDLWRVPLSSIERVLPGRPRSTGLVVMDPSDPTSPLTLNAVQETNKAIARSQLSSPSAYVTVHGIPLAGDSFARLLPSAWFNDEIINGYAQLQRERHGCLHDPAAGPVLVLSTYFFSKLFERKQYCYLAVQRWTRKVHVLQKDKIFIPVNVNANHWVGVLVEPRSCVVSVYDSLGTTPSEVGLVILRWLRDEAVSRGLPQRAWTVSQQPCRKQENYHDCGVFTVKMMDFLLQGRPLSELTSSTAYYRRRIAAELIAGTI